MSGLLGMPGPRPSAARHLGVLMLDTRFPRVVGDAGHAASWAMPVRLHVVRGASPRRVVAGVRDDALLQPFVDAARALVAGGAAAVTTSCGFLAAFQSELQAAVPVPVWTSSLLLLPALDAPGVVTVDAEALAASGLAGTVPVDGLAPDSAFRRTLLDDLPALDGAEAEAAVVGAATRLVARASSVRTLVLECTNMPPYAAAVAAATGRPVRHLVEMVHQRWRTLR